MAQPQDKIIKIVDGETTTRELSLETVGSQNAAIVKVVSAPAVTVDTTGLATDSNQTDGSQKTQIVDGSGNVVGVTANKLDVNASIDPAGLATEAKQDDIITAIGAIPGGGGVQYIEGDIDATITGTALMFRNGSTNIVPISSSEPLPVTTDLSTLATESTLGTMSSTLSTIETNTQGLALAANQQTDALTDTELRATPVPVSGTVTATATDLDIRPLVNTDVVTAELSAVDNAVLDTIAAKDFATQTTLALIKAKTDNIPALGQALAAASVPVILPSATITTLTPPAAITGYATETTLASIKDTAGIKKITDALPTGTNSIGKISDITASVTPGTAAANLGKAEDAAHTSGDVGVMMLGVRNEGHDDFSGTDKDYVPIATDATGDVYVSVRHPLVAGSAVIGKVGIDQTTPGTTNKVTVGSDVVHTIIDSGSTAVTNTGTFATQSTLAAETTKVIGVVRNADGSGNLLTSTTNALDVNVKNTSIPVTDNSGSLTVDYATTGSGTATGALRVELPTNGTGTVGLNAGTNAIGKLAANSGVDIGDVTLTANSGIDIGDVDVTSIVPGTGATNLGKAEDAGHTSADVGIYNLGVRNDTPNTATTNTDADYSSITTDRVGGVRLALYETDFAVLGTNHVKKYYTNAGAVTDGIVWSPAAGKRWYVTDITIQTSAAATVTLEDDKAGGDEVVAKFELAANSGWDHSYHTPLFSGEDAADLMVTTSAGNIYITVTGYEI